MARNLRMHNLIIFTKRMGLNRNFWLLRLFNKMGVVERKNRVIQEMARVMLLNKQIPQKFWGEAVNTSCHIDNRIYF